MFYDKFEEADLWGKDLYTHLSDIYQNKAQFTVMFISKSYAQKVWTTHERRSAQERALRENVEYILPARFDDSEVPGLHSTIGYLDLRTKTPEEVVNLLITKINKSVGMRNVPEYNDELLSHFVSHLSLDSWFVLYALRCYNDNRPGLASAHMLFDTFFFPPLEKVLGPFDDKNKAYLDGQFNAMLNVLEAMGLVRYDGEAETFRSSQKLIKAVKNDVRKREEVVSLKFKGVIEEMNSAAEKNHN